MELNKNVPAIRFKGFNDPWEIKLVEYFLEERNEQLPKNLEYPLMAFVAYKGISNKGDRYNREFLVNDSQNKKYKRTELGDFIYSSNNLETGSIGLNNYGKACISPVYSVFKPTQFGDSSFIGNLLKQKSFVNKMVRWRQGVVYGQWKIHESNFLRISEYIPNLNEQIQIGNFFKTLDEQINLQEQKHQKLVNLKKAMLEKMFPKEGADVPEIRFKGFTDKWEEKKFGDYFNFDISTNSLSRSELDNNKGIIKNIHYGDILVKYNFILDVDQSAIPLIRKGVIKDFKSSLLKDNDIIFADAAEDLIVGKAIELINIHDNFIVSGLHTIVARPKINFSKFYLGYYLNSISYRYQLMSMVQGTKVYSLSKNNFRKSLFKFPSLEEQRKIGEYFEQLDTLIEQSQVQIEKHKNIKQALLQKMFV